MKNKKLDIELLKLIIRMDQKKLYKYLYAELSQHYNSIDTDGVDNRFLFCQGESPVMLVSHLDTVFEQTTESIYADYFTEYSNWSAYSTYTDPAHKEIFQDRVEEVMWSPDGLGADDRVGVFLMLSMVQAGLKPSILFTTDEETGSASGRAFADKYRANWMKSGVKYIMQLDRSGFNDCVFYQCNSPKFEQYIESFGFKTARGSFSDISVLCPILGVAGVNLSVGYFNEHSQTEMIDLFTMSKNYDIIYYMVEKSLEIKKPYLYIPKAFKSKAKGNQAKDIEIKGDEVEICVICSTPMTDYVYAKDFGKICLDCYLELYQ